MLILRIVIRVVLMGLITLGGGVVSGQAYPTKSIRILAGSVGGGSDVTARLLAQGITSSLGQPVIVENRPAVLIPEMVAKAPPDGYLIFISGSNLWISPLLQKTPYDIADFVPIGMVINAPDVLVVHPSLPVKSAKDLIALAKARPGVLNYASSTTGGGSHLEGELFKSLAGVNIVRIVYKGSAEQLTGVVSGEVELMFSGAAAAAPLLKSGRLKALGVVGARPSAMVPGVPAIAASLPGFDILAAAVQAVHAKTPAAIVNRLNQEVVRILKQPDAKEKLFSVGIEPSDSSPEQVLALMKADMARMGKMIKETGIKGE